jgi:hypothetical protein
MRRNIPGHLRTAILAMSFGFGLECVLRMVSYGVVAGLLLLWPSTVVGAQVEGAAAPQPASSSHRFFDATNIALTAMESGALLADGVYTQRALTKYPGIFREADPIARPFVSRGWPGQIAGGTLFVAADVGLRYWLHRKKHHRLERLSPLVLTVYGTVGAIHGARALRRVDKAYDVLGAEAVGR